MLNTGLSDKNLIRAINSHVLPVVAYVFNVCKVSGNELIELDMIEKRALREKTIPW